MKRNYETVNSYYYSNFRDSKNTQLVLETYKQLTHELGQTIIAVTHDGDFAKATDRTFELKDGKIIH